MCSYEEKNIETVNANNFLEAIIDSQFTAMCRTMFLCNIWANLPHHSMQAASSSKHGRAPICCTSDPFLCQDVMSKTIHQQTRQNKRYAFL